ncbi:Two-component system response regulator [hydrothermal vent metagenome]|uniref:Two-component system response regulator n=1 Tax=hydrothermal vent metagenome TaxID=652676 RepID=A0A1W1BUN3_9ZZZZ
MLRTIIIDNDTRSVECLKSLMDKLNDFEIIGAFSNPFEALKAVVSKDVQVVFIELNIPGFDGFDFIRNLSDSIQVVVISDVKEYAIEAFELEVLDYLIKPISQQRFLKTISRLYKLNAISTPSIERSYVYVKVDKKMVKIYHDQILFIESVGDYIKIVCKEEVFISNSTLKGFTSELPNDQFLRVHRSYTISIPRVTALEGNTIEIGSNRIPVGRQYLSEARKSIIS